MKFSLVSFMRKLTQEQRQEAIPVLLETGELTEQDISEFEATDVQVNLPKYAKDVQTDPDQRYLWYLFQEHPRYLARALVQTFPKLYYSHGFAMRMIFSLKAKLGNILVTVPPLGAMPEPTVFMEKLPEYVRRDLSDLYRECRFRECLYFMTREQETGFDYIEEESKRSTSEFDRKVLEGVREYATKLFAMRFPDFVPSIGKSLFPSFHVRWWIDRIKEVSRCLCIGGTSTQKTAFGVVAMHHYGCRKVLVICTANARTQWERETRSYFRNPEARVCLVGNRQDVDTAIQSDVQYTIVAYTTLIRGDTLEKFLQMPFDGIIWDECQYGKSVSGSNPAQRAQACMELIRSLPMKRLIALSATPWENDPRELGAVASALMPEVVPSADAFRKWNVRDPRFLREFMASHVVEVEISEIHDLPNIEPKPWKDLFGAELIQMNPRHQELYRFVQDDATLALQATQKINHLLQATTHPHRLRDAYVWPDGWKERLQNWELSTKLVWLKERMKIELEKGAKVAIGSGIYAEGITRSSAEEQDETVWVGGLLKEWFGEDRVLILDASVSLIIDANGISDRDRLISRWRCDPRIRILLISMRTCPDSVHLTIERQSGIEKLFITALSFGWKPWEQFLGRFYRVGQQVPIEYAVPILRGTIDENLLELLKKKNLTNQLFRAQVELTDEEWSYYASRDMNAQRLLDASRSPLEHVNHIAARMKGGGEQENEKTLQGSWGISTTAEVFARSYLATQEYTASGHISRCMEPVILEFEKGTGILPEEILDAGCGPLTLERRLNQPVYGIDMNPYMIELGRMQSPHKGMNAEVGYLSRLPCEWIGKFGFVICALVLHWSSTERRAILSELVRVASQAGIIWIAVAESMLDQNLLQRWADALQDLEYVIVEELTGLVRSRDGGTKGRQFQFWSLCFTPNGKPFTPKSPKDFRFLFEEERMKYDEGGSEDVSVTPRVPEQVIHHSFEIIGLNGERLAAQEAAQRVVQQISATRVTTDTGRKEPRIRPDDWRTYVRLQKRRKAGVKVD